MVLGNLDVLVKIQLYFDNSCKVICHVSKPLSLLKSLSQCLSTSVGEDRHLVKKIHKFPFTHRFEDRVSEEDIDSTFKGLQSKASKDLGWRSIYIQHYFIIDHSYPLLASSLLKISLGIYHLRSIERWKVHWYYHEDLFTSTRGIQEVTWKLQGLTWLLHNWKDIQGERKRMVATKDIRSS